MFSKGRTKGTTRFALRTTDRPSAVAVAGDFSAWQPLPMKKQRDGLFVRHVATPTDGFQYKFIVDGRWMTDPDKSHFAPDPYGGVNSVAPDGDGAVSRL